MQQPTYKSELIEIIVRLDLDLRRKFDFLIAQHGNQNEAIAYAINHAYVGDRLHRDRVEELEDEKAELADKITALEAQLKTVKHQGYTQEERDELLEIALNEWDKRKIRGTMSSTIEENPLDFDSAQFDIT
jgi:hypothetical protein